MSNILKQKKLPDGYVLNLVAWISDCIRPGEEMRRISLLADGQTTYSYPIDYEHFTHSQIEEIYERISSNRTFEELLKFPERKSIEEFLPTL